MNGKNEIPFLFCHSLERFVADDTSICDKHMDGAELFQSNLNDLVAIFS
jgi:hypothetical protein